MLEVSLHGKIVGPLDVHEDGGMVEFELEIKGHRRESTRVWVAHPRRRKDGHKLERFYADGKDVVVTGNGWRAWRESEEHGKRRWLHVWADTFHLADTGGRAQYARASVVGRILDIPQLVAVDRADRPDLDRVLNLTLQVWSPHMRGTRVRCEIWGSEATRAREVLRRGDLVQVAGDLRDEVFIGSHGKAAELQLVVDRWEGEDGGSGRPTEFDSDEE